VRSAQNERDIALVAGLAGLIAEGIRRAILTTALAAAAETDPPGLIVLSADRSVDSITATAERWLAEMIDSTGTSAPVPLIVMTVANQARRAGAGTTDDVATARVPTRTGRWLLLHAFLLDGAQQGRVGVMLHPAAQPDVAQLIVEAYGLSRRERDVTRLVLRGFSTREIADALHVTPYTVQDHLKAIFDKMGVRSRRELVAQLFFRHYAPRIEAKGRSVRMAGSPPDQDDERLPAHCSLILRTRERRTTTVTRSPSTRSKVGRRGLEPRT
jgi:DNA-binding CsgD family transcriptional regulator